MTQVAQWTVFETAFQGSGSPENPLWEVDCRVTFTAPDGQTQPVDAFWDGGSTWRVRFSPTQVGTWRWQTACPQDAGLDGQQGTFDCVVYEGDNPLYQHGPLELSANQRYMQHADGTPFFWLGDTAWNGVLLAQEADWAQYLTTRRAQGFSAIQFVTTQWRASTKGDSQGEAAYSGTDRIVLNPAFFQRADPKIAAINAHGLIAAPVMLWTLTETDPGQTLSEAGAIRLARYQAARWGAYQVAWLLGGDGCYARSGLTGKFQAIGRATFGDRHDRLVTLHPCGVTWTGDDFRDEPWFDFIGYQSGHGDSDDHVRWLTQGPPAAQWADEPVLPVINLEPNYEGHPSYHHKQRFSDYHVRRAAYWSLLVSPTAGVTYGNNEIWLWSEAAAPAENHPNIGMVQPWHAGVDTPGTESMRLLKQLFAQVRWHDLAPAPDLIRKQCNDPDQFIAAARTVDGTQMVVYLPMGGSVDLTQRGPHARWFDPRTGVWSAAEAIGTTYTAPDAQDWLLVVEV